MNEPTQSSEPTPETETEQQPRKTGRSRTAKDSAEPKSTGGKKLATHVHVDGKTYAPGDTPPAEVAAQITNPKAWA